MSEGGPGAGGTRRSVVVTGAANGIGRAIAGRLAGDGWSVVGVDHETRPLEEAMGALGATAVVGDVRDHEVLEAARGAAEQEAQLRAWVNNAGIVRLGPLHLMSPETIADVLDVDLLAVILGTRQAIRSFLGFGVPGAIVNISSVHARAGFPGYGAYDAAKGGVEAFTRHVCVEYGHLGIRCNAVAPGAVRTDIATRAANAGALPPDRVPSPVEQLDPRALAPMRRQSEAGEIAAAVAFLLDDSSSSAVNGHVLAVDNGMSSWSFPFAPDPAVQFNS